MGKQGASLGRSNIFGRLGQAVSPTSRTRLSVRRVLALSTAGALVAITAPGVARADSIQNTLVAGGSPTVMVGASTSIGYSIQAPNPAKSNDPQAGCNAADGSAATLTVNAPSAVTVTPRSRVYTMCKTDQYFNFSSATAGTYSITVSVTDANTVGLYSTSGATFTLTVTRPLVVNTAPTVTMSNVTNGAAYDFGHVPVARCNVSDKEDGNTTFDASLSAITGTRAAEGLGTQTASCNYNDAGGLNARASATYSIVDTSKPLVTVAAPAATEATGKLTPVTFAASAYDAVDGNQPVACKTGGGTVYASGGSFAVGTTALTCSATDKAGNTGTSDPFDVVVTDTTPPVITTPANIVVGKDAASLSYADATAADLVDGTLAAGCTPASGSTFPLGTTTVTCTATDTAGNKGTNTFTVEVQDVTKPIVTVPADKNVEATGPNGAIVTYGAVTAEDDVDGSLTATCSKISDTVFPLGSTNVTCSAKDAAGNIGDSFFTVRVQDTTAPAVIVPANISKEATGAAGVTASFSATASDAVDGSVATTCEPASGSTVALGAATVICSATDAAGNTGTASFTVTVRDTTAPAVTVPSDAVAEATGPTGAEVVYGDVSASDIVDGPMNPSCSQASDSLFPLGTTTVTCTAIDAGNNTGYKSFTVTIVDTTAPEVHAPANLVIGNTSGMGADNVVYSGATAHDLVSGNLSVTCTPATGSSFALGMNTVTCTATDTADNNGTATFTIEVQDRTKPIVTVPADITTDATGANGATVTYMGVTATDDVEGPLTATCSKASGSVFPIGTTTVTCTAIDRAGNTGDSTFTVTIKDMLPAQVDTLSFLAVADTYVSASTPDTSFGDAASVAVDASPLNRTLLKFELSGLTGRVVTGVRLRMKNVDSSVAGGSVYRVPAHDWTETTTWPTQPVMGTTVLGDFGPVTTGITYEASLENLSLADGTYSLAMASSSSDASKWASRQSTTPPQLLVDVQRSPGMVIDGTSTVLGAFSGSSDPTFFSTNKRLAVTAAGRSLTVSGVHKTGIQLSWRDPGGGWMTRTKGDAQTGLLLAGTGTGDWPASIVVAQSSDGVQRAWVVWAGANPSSTVTGIPVQLRQLTDLDSPGGPTVGPLVSVAEAGLGNYRADIALYTSAAGHPVGAVTWLRRTGDTSYDIVVARFMDTETDFPAFENPAVLAQNLNNSGGAMVSTLVPTGSGLTAVVRPRSGSLTTYTLADAGAGATWRVGGPGVTIQAASRPAGVSLADGSVVVAVESDVAAHVVTVQAFTSSGVAQAIAARWTGYEQPTISTDGSRILVVMVRSSDGAIVSRGV